MKTTTEFGKRRRTLSRLKTFRNGADERSRAPFSQSFHRRAKAFERRVDANFAVFSEPGLGFGV
jgi:hypothetical protein